MWRLVVPVVAPPIASITSGLGAGLGGRGPSPGTRMLRAHATVVPAVLNVALHAAARRWWGRRRGARLRAPLTV